MRRSRRSAKGHSPKWATTSRAGSANTISSRARPHWAGRPTRSGSSARIWTSRAQTAPDGRASKGPSPTSPWAVWASSSGSMPPVWQGERSLVPAARPVLAHWNPHRRRPAPRQPSPTPSWRPPGTCSRLVPSIKIAVPNYFERRHEPAFEARRLQRSRIKALGFAVTIEQKAA